MMRITGTYGICSVGCALTRCVDALTSCSPSGRLGKYENAAPPGPSLATTQQLPADACSCCKCYAAFLDCLPVKYPAATQTVRSRLAKSDPVTWPTLITFAVLSVKDSCLYVALSLSSFVAVSLCNCVAVSLCHCVAEKLRRLVAEKHCCCVPEKLCRCVAVSLSRCVAERHCCCVAQKHCRCVAEKVCRCVAK